MTEPQRVVVDANIVIYLLTDSSESNSAKLWGRLTNTHQVWLPDLVRWEITNALYRSALAAYISPDMAESGIVAMGQLGLNFDPGVADHVRATRIARQCGFKQAYDAHYLALAERLGCDLWTADKELHRKASPLYSWIHYLDRSDISE